MISRHIGSTPIAALVAFAIAAMALASGLAASADSATPPTPKASDFTTQIDNPWYPLKPGTTYIYRGIKDGQVARDVLMVTHQTRNINGIPSVVVKDRLYLDGKLHERTTEWYSQDKQGNVWYLGENTAELDKTGHVVNTDGTWLAGVKGATAGIFMFAKPRVGQFAQQELLKGEAEDNFKVLNLHASVTVPHVSSKRAVLTKEWTPLEPGVIDHKLYVRGIGTVLEMTVKGGHERLALISMTHSN